MSDSSHGFPAVFSRPVGNRLFFRTSRRVFQRTMCVLVVVCLLSSSTPAGPRTLVELSVQWPTEVGMWLRVHDVWPQLLGLLNMQSASASRQEDQADRDGRVSSVQIFPGDVTVQEGQQVNFTAVAYDVKNSPVSGVKFVWRAVDEDRGRNTRVSPRGDFKATVSGNFTVTVQGA